LHPISCAAAALSVGVLLAFLGEMLRYEKPDGVIVKVALAVLPMAYVGLLMSFLIALRCYQSNELGMAALLSMIVVVKLSDTGAYTFGKLFGRHKMAPVLSPKKTVEGAIGGVVTACAASWAFFRYLAPLILGSVEFEPTTWGWLWYGLVLAMVAMVGDLAMSLFKRDMGRKDSSRWLPGLGGVLDVLDSILASAPAAYFCWVAGVIGKTVG
jgi:phosphatidate cytidylyltransferase